MAISMKPELFLSFLAFFTLYFLLFLLHVKLALATAVQFSHRTISTTSSAGHFDIKAGAFIPIRKPRDAGNEVGKYKQIDCKLVDGIAE